MFFEAPQELSFILSSFMEAGVMPFNVLNNEKENI